MQTDQPPPSGACVMAFKRYCPCAIIVHMTDAQQKQYRLLIECLKQSRDVFVMLFHFVFNMATFLTDYSVPVIRHILTISLQVCSGRRQSSAGIETAIHTHNTRSRHCLTPLLLLGQRVSFSLTVQLSTITTAWSAVWAKKNISIRSPKSNVAAESRRPSWIFQIEITF
jgi:hypothetical protein